MRDFLARERKQMQAEQALRERQREELRLWLEALRSSSKAEALVRPCFILRLLLVFAPDKTLQRSICCHCVTPWELDTPTATLTAETTVLNRARVYAGRQKMCRPRPMSGCNNEWLRGVVAQCYAPHASGAQRR